MTFQAINRQPSNDLKFNRQPSTELIFNRQRDPPPPPIETFLQHKTSATTSRGGHCVLPVS